MDYFAERTTLDLGEVVVSEFVGGVHGTHFLASGCAKHFDDLQDVVKG